MSVARRRVLAFTIGCSLLVTGMAAAVASAAEGAPEWQLTSIANTAVAPGEDLTFFVEAKNIGTSRSDGSEIVMTTKLPPGMQAVAAEVEGSAELGSTEQKNHYQCRAGDGVSPVAGASEIRCVNTEVVEDTRENSGTSHQTLVLTVKVDPAAEGTLTAAFGVVGGGGVAASTVDPTSVTDEPTQFGVDAFDMQLNDANGNPLAQAGGHAADVVTNIDFNAAASSDPEVHGPWPVSPPRDVVVDLPAGFVGNPTVLAQCTSSELIGERGATDSKPGCPSGSQVGVVFLTTDGPASTKDRVGNTMGPFPLFNMVPPLGAPARFAFAVLGTVVVLDANLNASRGYGLTVVSSGIAQVLPVIGVQTVFWGVPGAAVHDSERGCPNQRSPWVGGPTCPGVSGKPFFRNPTSCTGEGLPFAVHIDSWSQPAAFNAEGDPNLEDPNWKTRAVTTHEAPGYPYPEESQGPELGMTGCDRVPVKGKLVSVPSALEAETPSGLVAHVEIPNPGLENTEGIASSDAKTVKVALPVGMTINPSQGEGLGVCTLAQYASTQLSFHPDGTKGCPSNSKIGSVVLHTPLLEEAIEGDVYIAKPFHNPFGSLLALYMVLESPERGILIKQAGKVETDPVTGQIVTTFDNIVQVPFSNFDFKFREGARAPLVTPATCGTYTTKTWFTPWSNPSTQLESDSQFQIVKGLGGGPCPPGGVPPFSPQMVSGTLNNAAGAYSQFYLHISRKDGEQEVTRFSTILPPGVTGNLTGIPFCPDSAIETARHRTGAQEIASPSCPAASEIGHTIVGAGVGSVVAHTPGKIYLAGPYKGSALSIVSVTSATVGPFDLGTVVIRFGLHINPVTAQVEIDASGSDPIPHIIDGIVVHVRDIRVYMDRPNFTRNPTNCGPMNVTNTITGAGADYTNPADQDPVSVTAHFEAADCSLLGFKPTFKASTSGKTSRTSGASLSVKLTYPNAPEGSQANIRSVKVDLPKQLPSRLTTLQKACLDSVFEANPSACPAESRVGMAKAVTPILPVPLVGPAYFVSHGGAKFPELIIVIQGYGFTIDLHGETFINKAGITSSTFRTVPDEPVTSFELTLPQGPNSALAANGDLCATTKTVLVKRKVAIRSSGHTRMVTRTIRETVAAGLVMPTAFTAQNGAVIHQNTPIEATGCAGRKAKTARQGYGHSHHGKGGRA